MATSEIIICNLREEIQSIIGDGVDLSGINEAINNIQDEIDSLKMTSGAILFPGELEENSASKLTDYNAFAGHVLYLPSGVASSDFGGSYRIKGLPYGAYSIILRCSSSVAGSTNATELFTVEAKSVGITTDGQVSTPLSGSNLKSVSIAPKNFSKANTYNCLSFGFDYNYQGSALVGTWDHDELRISINVPSTASGANVKIDSIRVIPAGTALGSIG